MKLIINEYDKDSAWFDDAKIIKTFEETIEAGLIWDNWNKCYSNFYARDYVAKKYKLPFFGVIVRNDLTDWKENIIGLDETLEED